MTKAEEIVKSGKIPDKWIDKAGEVTGACKDGWMHLESEPEDGELHQRLMGRVPHAYCYMEAGDGSIVALWANTKTGNVKMKAFENIEEASRWSPRDEG